MKRSSVSTLAPKKEPSQARSKQLVAAILEAAVRVLAREGARRFTTVRVAEAAGVSVGSLYQYFPNKESLLFRLQSDEWATTGASLAEMLADESLAPLVRYRRMIVAFFRSEHEEASLRGALDEAGRLFHDAPEARAMERKSLRMMETFLTAALPTVTPAERRFTAELLGASLGALTERLTREPGRMTLAKVEAFAHATAEMHCLYLERLAQKTHRGAAKQKARTR